MSPAERIALLVATAGLLVLLIGLAGLLAIGLGAARFFARLTRGDLGSPYHPDDPAFGARGPAAPERGDDCPRCGRHYRTREGARVCYELCSELEGGATP